MMIRDHNHQDNDFYDDDDDDNDTEMMIWASGSWKMVKFNPGWSQISLP